MLQDHAKQKAGINDEEWSRFIAYVAGFYSNMSNYHSFGHSKFIPELEPAKFKAILISNPLYDDLTNQMYKEYINRLYPLVEREIFAMETPFASLGFPDQGGITGYFSPNMSQADLALIREFLAEK